MAIRQPTGLMDFITVELTGGGSGNVSSITVDGVEVLGATITYTTSLTVTASLIAAQINAYQSVPKYTATSSGAVITIKAMPGTGTGPNDFTDTNFGADGAAVAGVAGVNGLTFGTVSAGVLSKSGDTWSGVNSQTGTAVCSASIPFMNIAVQGASFSAEIRGAVAFFTTVDGLCAGRPDGSVAQLTSNAYKLPTVKRGAVMVRDNTDRLQLVTRLYN